MRSLLILFLLFSLSGFSQKTKTQKKTGKKENHGVSKKIRVVISVTGTSSYCGGAHLTPEMMAALSNPRALAGKKVCIKKGEKNDFSNPVLLELTADDSGKISCSLPPGKYILVDESRKDKTFYNDILKKYSKKTEWQSAVDEKCLKGWYEKADLVFEVKASEKNKFTVNFHTGCNWNKIPCSQYSGPLPP
jgi:hypothetical protein